MPFPGSSSISFAYGTYFAGDYASAFHFCAELLNLSLDFVSRDRLAPFEKLFLTLIQAASLQRQPLKKSERKPLVDVEPILLVAVEYLRELRETNELEEVSVELQEVEDALSRDILMVQTALKQVKSRKKDGDSFGKWKDGVDGVAGILNGLKFDDKAGSNVESTVDGAEEPKPGNQEDTNALSLEDPLSTFTMEDFVKSLQEYERNLVESARGFTVTGIPKDAGPTDGTAKSSAEHTSDTDETVSKNKS